MYFSASGIKISSMNDLILLLIVNFFTEDRLHCFEYNGSGPVQYSFTDTKENKRVP